MHRVRKIKGDETESLSAVLKKENRLLLRQKDRERERKKENVAFNSVLCLKRLDTYKDKFKLLLKISTLRDMCEIALNMHILTKCA